ncbi:MULTISPECIES: hypothetical protein [unclassified Spirosoma]|uniref:hypothetical protein n=1 Tax=unclassified Spirosoma TaxID=2621999 RepID=UPI000B26CDA6|nr:MULTISPECIES: hypothetical protein [unclassified Spirosoma]MBN8822164.1 hypothetical protein [Spirosoma sp.]
MLLPFIRGIIRALLLLTLCFVGSSIYVQGQNLQGLHQQKPFSIRGSLSAGLTFYQANGITNRRQPVSWYLSGSPIITVYGVAMPFSLVVSEQERRFSQPFNQYGVSPYYKWAKLHLGYRNIRFSNYTLGGANFWGTGVELTPGRWRIGAVYGRFNRAVNEDTVVLEGRNQYVRPTYRRVGYGLKLGYGKPGDYVDMTFFKATDDINSIQAPSRQSLVTPMENIAAGIHSQFGFWKHKLTFDIDLGASLLTRNLLLSRGNSRFTIQGLDKLIWINESTAFFTAGQVAANYQLRQGGIGLVYQRIDPDYQSLGSYFFQNDLEQITINPRYSFLAGRLNLSGSYGVSRDNLSGLRGFTTHRTVGSAALSFIPAPALQVNLGYSNFGLGQFRGFGDAFNDSLAVSVINASYTGSVAYRLSNRQMSHGLTLSGTYQNTNDQNQYTRQYTAASSELASLTYNLTWPVQHINAAISGSYVAIESFGRNIANVGIALNLGRQWFNGKLRTTLNHSNQKRTANGQADGQFISTGLSVAIRQGKQNLTVNGFYVYNQYGFQADGLQFRTFAELRGNLLYGISF